MTEMTDSELLSHTVSSGSRIFLIGIGGISMHALALICADRGAIVSGYDRKADRHNRQAHRARDKVRFEHTGEFLRSRACGLYLGNPSNNEEWIDTERQVIRSSLMPSFPVRLCQNTNTASVSAARMAKAPAPSMVSHIFTEANTPNPTIVSGAESIELGSAYLLARGRRVFHIRGRRVYGLVFVVLSHDRGGA